MATITITPGNTFNPTETVTSTKLNDLGSPTAALTTGSIVPTDLSTGSPSWDASGALLSSNVTAPESANSLLLRSDPESPGSGTDGGSQIRLFSSDSAFPDQIFYKADFHSFTNIAGDVQGSIPYAAIPTEAKHFTRKDYVDGYALTYSGATGTFNTTAATFVDLNLSAVVGSNRALVILEVYNCNIDNSIFFRTKGSTVLPYLSVNYFGVGSSATTLAVSDTGGTVVVMTDQNGIIQYRADSTSTGVEYTVQAFQKLLIPTP